MSEELIKCLIAFILGWIASRMMGNGFSVGARVICAPKDEYIKANPSISRSDLIGFCSYDGPNSKDTKTKTLNEDEKTECIKEKKYNGTQVCELVSVFKPTNNRQLKEAVVEALKGDPTGKNAWYNGVHISEWDTSEITDMSNLFRDISANPDIKCYSCSHIIDPVYDHNTKYFNGDLSSWDVSAVKDMAMMFGGAASFNGDLSSWDVSAVTNMAYMFYDAKNFNGDIKNWNISKVEATESMFFGATRFNQDLSKWDIKRVHILKNMFRNTNLDVNNGLKLRNWSINCGDHDDTEYMFDGTPFYHNYLVKQRWLTDQSICSLFDIK